MEDFFGMCVRYLKYMPEIVLQSNNCLLLWQLSLEGIGLQHFQAAQCLYGFLDKSVSKLKGFSTLNLTNMDLQSIVHKLIKAILDVPNSSIIPFITDVLWSIVDNFQELSIEIMTQGMLHVPLDVFNDIEK